MDVIPSRFNNDILWESFTNEGEDMAIDELTIEYERTIAGQQLENWKPKIILKLKDPKDLEKGLVKCRVALECEYRKIKGINPK